MIEQIKFLWRHHFLVLYLHFKHINLKDVEQCFDPPTSSFSLKYSSSLGSIKDFVMIASAKWPISPSYSFTNNFYSYEPTETVKDLGVIFDKNLTFNEHVIKTVSSCMSTLGQISRVKHAFRRDILIIIINSLVFSKLYYCSSVWANTTDNNIKKLQGIQNFAARIVCNIRKYDHVTTALERLNWIPVESNLYLRDAVMAFKCMKELVPRYLSNESILRGSISGRVTRSSQKLNIPLCKKPTGQRSFYYRIISIWNAISHKLN